MTTNHGVFSYEEPPKVLRASAISSEKSMPIEKELSNLPTAGASTIVSRGGMTSINSAICGGCDDAADGRGEIIDGCAACSRRGEFFPPDEVTR